MVDPWMVIGNFNCTLKDEERSSHGGIKQLLELGVKERSNRYGLGRHNLYMELWHISGD